MTKISLLRSLIIIILFSGLFFLFHNQANALTITCAVGTCVKKDADSPLFNETNIYPTWSTSKTFTAENNYNRPRKFAIKIKQKNGWGSEVALEKVLNISIYKEPMGTSSTSELVYGPKKLSELQDDKYIVLSEIPANADQIYRIDVSTDDVGNEYMNKSITFDLTLAFDTVDVPNEEENDDDDDDDDDERSDDDDQPQILGVQTSLLSTQTDLTQPTDELPVIENISLDSLDTEGEVAGVFDEKCYGLWWVIPALIAQAVIQYIIKRSVFQDTSKGLFTYYLTELITGGIFLYAFWKYFCPEWDVYISGLMGIMLMIRYKRS